MSEKTCIICGAPLEARQQKYCSRPCAIKGNTIARANSPERMARHVARKAEWQRANRAETKRYRDTYRTKRVTRICPWCKEPYEVRPDSDARACCKQHARWAGRGEGPTCKWRPPYVAPDMRSPLRRAIEGGDSASVVTILRARTVTTIAGCWEWQGRTKDGYAIVSVGSANGNNNRAAHRLMATAVYGPLGKQHVHHACANPKCINPAHLQPVTQRENTAEMLERKYYRERIHELEDALRILDPLHPLVRRLAIAEG